MKINPRQHITKKGIVKRNPVKKKIELVLYKLKLDRANDDVSDNYFKTVYSIEEANDFLFKHDGFVTYKDKQVGYNWGSRVFVTNRLKQVKR